MVPLADENNPKVIALDDPDKYDESISGFNGSLRLDPHRTES
jgi:hypothetical protein